LEQLVLSLRADDEIILTNAEGRNIARIIPFAAPRKKRAPGAWKGLLTIVEDDDKHLEDFKDYMP